MGIENLLVKIRVLRCGHRQNECISNSLCPGPSKAPTVSCVVMNVEYRFVEALQVKMPDEIALRLQ